MAIPIWDAIQLQSGRLPFSVKCDGTLGHNTMNSLKAHTILYQINNIENIVFTGGLKTFCICNSFKLAGKQLICYRYKQEIKCHLASLPSLPVVLITD
jgi:hypothetical protein